MRSAAACCAGTGSTNPVRTVLGALLDHVAQRQQESPDYYERMPDLTGKTAGPSWTLPCVCGFCWTRKRTPPNRWTCWAIPAIRVRPAVPAMRHAHRPQRSRPRHRSHRCRSGGDPVQRGGGELWKTAMWARPFRENELARYYRDAENYLAPLRKGTDRIQPGAGRKKRRHEPARQSTKQGQNRPRKAQSRKTAAAPKALRQQKHHSAQPQLGTKAQHGRPQKETERTAAINRVHRSAGGPAAGACRARHAWAWAQPDRLFCPWRFSEKKPSLYTVAKINKNAFGHKPKNAHLAGNG